MTLGIFDKLPIPYLIAAFKQYYFFHRLFAIGFILTLFSTKYCTVVPLLCLRLEQLNLQPLNYQSGHDFYH